ncbi:MAG: glycosyltransferase family 4 protein [Candidatus Natronoplasma sp.]
MKELLIITNNFPPERSGNASRIHDLTKNLVKLGLDVTVICPHPTIPIGNFSRKMERKTEDKIDGIDVDRIWTWQPKDKDPSFLSRMGYYLLFPIHSLLYILKYRDDYDVILTTSPPIFVHIPGLFAKKILDKKWVLDIRDLWIDASSELGFIDDDSFFKKVSEKFERVCLKFSDIISITTRKMEEKLESKYGLNLNDKFLFLPNGVDTEMFYSSNSEKQNLIIYTGLLGHAQDLESPILAMQKIKDMYDVRLKIVGDGDTREDLERLVRTKGLEDVVEFEGLVTRERIPEFLSRAKVGIAPIKGIESLDYAVPSKIFEYMACELPFVSSGIGEVQRLTEESKAGLLAQNNAESFADKLSSLLDDEARLEDMGKKGRTFVEENFDRKIIAMKLKSAIEGNT